MLLDHQRALVKELVVLLDVSQSIARPEEREVSVDLVDQLGLQWLVLVRKSSQSHDPVVQVRTLIVVTHSLVIVLDDLLEGVHDVREETYSSQHEEYGDDQLVGRNRVVVTVAHCG